MNLKQHMKSILCDESKWIQGWFAFDKEGEKTWGNDPGATCWCLMGALRKFDNSFSLGVRQWNAANDLIHSIIQKLAIDGKLPRETYSSVADFNDDPDTKFEHVQLVLDNLPEKWLEEVTNEQHT